MSSPLETAVPNTVYMQAVEKPVPEHVIVSTLASNGRRDPDAIRDALEVAVDRGDIEYVEGGYQPGEWDEYRPANAL